MVEAIGDDDRLYRRLSWAHVNDDGTVNSAAYKTPSSHRQRLGEYDPSISVDLARLTTLEDALGRAPRPGGGIGELVAVEVRTLSFTVRHDPQQDNLAHSLIEGENTRAKSRKLAAMTRLRVAPQPPPGI